MAGNPYLWSITALSNESSDPDINWAEGQLPGTVNGSARGMMAGIAGWLKDTNGTLATGGSSNAYTVTSNIGFSSTPFSGARLCVKANHTNTGAATLNLTPAGGSAWTAKAIKIFTAGAGESDPAANRIRQNGHYLLEYDTAANGGSGAWILLNPSDDYTGPTSWTPIDSSGASLSLTASGSYVRIGQLVIASFSITFPATANGTVALIGGLPVSASTGTSWGGGGLSFPAFSSASVGAVAAFVLQNSTTFNLKAADGTNQTNANMSNIAIRGTIVYITG